MGKVCDHDGRKEHDGLSVAPVPCDGMQFRRFANSRPMDLRVRSFELTVPTGSLAKLKWFL